jgi:hypothetical protein
LEFINLEGFRKDAAPIITSLSQQYFYIMAVEKKKLELFEAFIPLIDN